MIPLVALILIVPGLVPVTTAQQNAQGEPELQIYVKPATEAAKSIADLFGIVTWLAVLVFVVTQVALFYTIWRFRRNRDVPTGETHRGHTKAEVLWTLIPALILVFVGVLSVQVLSAIEEPPAVETEDAITVDVQGRQFAWFYTYPEEFGGQTTDKLYVEEGQTIHLRVTSGDVQHSFWIPEFGIKRDAYPGRINEAYFTAPAPGEYFVQCAEYCGFGHHAMHSAVIVYPKGENEGRPVGEPPSDQEQVEVPPGPEASVRWQEQPGETPGPWSVAPPEITLEVQQGEGLHFTSTNDESNGGVHNFTIDGRFYDDVAYEPGQSRQLNLTLEQLGGEGTYPYYCAVPGHREQGMEGTLTVKVVE